MPAAVTHESCRDIGLEVGQSPQVLFVVKTDSQVTLTQLHNESVTTRSRPFANKFSYARDMCHGTSIHPASVKAVFDPGKSQKADGLTKVLTGALMKAFAQTTKWWWNCRRRLIHIEVVARILVAVPSWEAPRRSLSVSILMGLSHGNRGSHFDYVEPYLRWWCLLSGMLSSYGQRWIRRSKCGVGSDAPVVKGGALDLDTLTIVGATAPPKPFIPAPGVPSPPEYLPEMKDEQIVKNTIKALSPRIVAVHGPTGRGKSTVFPLAITHWTEYAKGLQPGLTICAQPRRILAQQLCERVRSNRKMHHYGRTVGYMIARESSKDSSTKLLYCTEAIAALMMQTYLVSSSPPIATGADHDCDH